MAFATERKHAYATLEHLLLGLADDADAARVLQACGVDLGKLRTDLTEFLEKDLAGLVVEPGAEPKPTAGFQRVVQRATMHVQSAGHSEVTGANVLVALFSERESHAVYFLQSQDMTRLDAVNFISHGLAKPTGRIRPRPVQTPEEQDKAHEGASSPPGQRAPIDPAATYKVLILHDDATPTAFFVEVLARVFGMQEEALTLTMELRRTGVAACGVFAHGVAEAKMAHVMDLARHARHPLQCTIEQV